MEAVLFKVEKSVRSVHPDFERERDKHYKYAMKSSTMSGRLVDELFNLKWERGQAFLATLSEEDIVRCKLFAKLLKPFENLDKYVFVKNLPDSYGSEGIGPRWLCFWPKFQTTKQIMMGAVEDLPRI